MKKVLSVIVLWLIIFVAAPVHAKSYFNFNEKFLPLSFWFAGVVQVSDYLAVREYPSVNSREVMRLYNGDRVDIKMGTGEASGWWELHGVNGISYRDRVGYVNGRYIRAWQ